MCNVNNLSLTICVTRTCMFFKIAIVIGSYEDLLKWWKAHKTQFPIVGYLVCQFLGIARSQIEAK